MNTLNCVPRQRPKSAAALATFYAHPPYRVFYPGRTDHPNHETATSLFGQQFGNMVTFEVAGGGRGERFMRALDHSVRTDVGRRGHDHSHPAVTSHRT